MPRASQRQALPARAGLGGKNHQTPDPPLGAASLKVRRDARTCQLHAVLGAVLILGSLLNVCKLILRLALHVSGDLRNLGYEHREYLAIFALKDF
jgi:hypothetical protein